MNRKDAIRELTTILCAMGAEKLPGVLRENPTRGQIAQAFAFVRSEIDEIERALVAEPDRAPLPSDLAMPKDRACCADQWQDGYCPVHGGKVSK